jgi:hypothetical protein
LDGPCVVGEVFWVLLDGEGADRVESFDVLVADEKEKMLV